MKFLTIKVSKYSKLFGFCSYINNVRTLQLNFKIKISNKKALTVKVFIKTSKLFKKI